MDLKNIKDTLNYMAVNSIYSLVESMLPKTGMIVENKSSMNEDFNKPSHMKRTLGRVAIVTRIRNGKVQFNKKVNIMGSGYKLTQGGLVVIMTPREVMVRKIVKHHFRSQRSFDLFLNHFFDFNHYIVGVINIHDITIIVHKIK